METEKAIRDILFFYHEQTNWDTISGDLSFGYTLALPYWDYLDIRGLINDDEIEFIRKGSLLILLSMSLEYFEELGSYFLADKEKFEKVKTAITYLNPQNQQEEEIQKMIFELLDKTENQTCELGNNIQKQLIKLNVTEIYGFYRSQYLAFDKASETLYLKYKNKGVE